MLALFSGIFGFAAPFLPEILKYFNRKQDNAHELAMFELRAKQQAAEHTYRMAEIDAKADIAEMQTLRIPQKSFGVALLDAAKGYDLSQWLFIPAFYAFTALDFFSGMVRPTITYAVIAFYMAYKYALYLSVVALANNTYQAILEIWSEQDMAIVFLVLSYWFGQRVAKAAFGGSASSNKPGQ